MLSEPPSMESPEATSDGSHRELLVGVVVDRGGDGGHVPHHQEARGLETNQQRLPGANLRPRDSHPGAPVGGPRRGAPSGERIGEGHLDARFAPLVGHQIGNPERRRAKVVTDLHGGRLRSARGGFLRIGDDVPQRLQRFASLALGPSPLGQTTDVDVPANSRRLNRVPGEMARPPATSAKAIRSRLVPVWTRCGRLRP